MARQSATQCEMCGRSLTYNPGQASEVLTAHYNARHRPPPGWEPRPVRVLRVLADVAGSLSTGTIADVLMDDDISREAAVRRYRAILGQLAAAEEVEATRATAGPAGTPEDLWRIADPGRRRLAAVDAAAAGENAPDPAFDRFGPGTPAGIRRRAAIIFYGQGYSIRQIARGFGVSASTIRTDLRQPGPAVSPAAAARALEKLAARAQDARQAQGALRDVRGQFGRGTPIAIRREAAAILHASIGLSSRDIGAVFGVSAAPIQQDLRRFPPPGPGSNAAARIRELALQAQEQAGPPR